MFFGVVFCAFEAILPLYIRVRLVSRTQNTSNLFARTAHQHVQRHMSEKGDENKRNVNYIFIQHVFGMCCNILCVEEPLFSSDSYCNPGLCNTCAEHMCTKTMGKRNLVLFVCFWYSLVYNQNKTFY
jgi:hypothetical protein